MFRLDTLTRDRNSFVKLAWLSVLAFEILLGLSVCVVRPELTLIAVLGFLALAFATAKILEKPYLGFIVLVAGLSCYYFLQEAIAFKLGLSRLLLSIVSRWQMYVQLLVLLASRSEYKTSGSKQTPVLLDILIVVYVLLGLIYSLFAPNLGALIWGLNNLYQYFLIYYVLSKTSLSSEQIQCLTYVMIGLGCAMSVFAFVQIYVLGPAFYILTTGHLPATYSNPVHPSLPRASSLSGSPGFFGSFLMVLLLQAVAFTLYSKTLKERLLWGTASGLMFMALVHTFHRSSWFGFGGGLIAILLLSAPKIRRLVLPGLLLVPLLALFLVRVDFLSIVTDAVTLKESSARSHVDMLLWNVAFLREHPWGLGIGRAGGVSRLFLSESEAVTNESWHFQVATEMGVMGLSVWAAITFAVILHCYSVYMGIEDRFLRAFTLGTLASFVGTTLFGIFLHFYEFIPAAVYTWLFIGLVRFHVKRIDREQAIRAHPKSCAESPPLEFAVPKG